MEQHPHKGICYASVLAKQVTSAGTAYAKFFLPKLSQPPIKKHVIHPNLGNQFRSRWFCVGWDPTIHSLFCVPPIHYLLGNRILLMA